MSEIMTQVKEAHQVIRSKTDVKPEIGIILGTGLGALAKDIHPVTAISYESIPYFPVSTVESHAGRLLLGTLMNKRVVVMQGRFHRYEGYTFPQITFPVRVMKSLGVKTLMVFSACGGIHRHYQPGDLVLLTDHINLMGDNPLIGPHDPHLGPRYPDMYNAYDQSLRAVALQVAQDLKIGLHQGVYAGLTGPNLETAAEYRFLQIIGADCVGMSTVPEVIVARHAGLKVMSISVVTDRCVPDQLGPANVDEIIRAAMGAEPKLTRLVKAILKKI